MPHCAVSSGIDSVGSMLPQLTVKLSETLKLDPERPEYHRATVGKPCKECHCQCRERGRSFQRLYDPSKRLILLSQHSGSVGCHWMHSGEEHGQPAVEPTALYEHCERPAVSSTGASRWGPGPLLTATATLCTALCTTALHTISICISPPPVGTALVTVRHHACTHS